MNAHTHLPLPKNTSMSIAALLVNYSSNYSSSEEEVFPSVWFISQFDKLFLRRPIQSETDLLFKQILQHLAINPSNNPIHPSFHPTENTVEF